MLFDIIITIFMKVLLSKKLIIMKSRFIKKHRKIILGAVSVSTLVVASSVIMACSSLESKAGTSYIGPRTTLRFYKAAAQGNSYVGQDMWFTNPDSNFALSTNLMGNEMNDSSRNYLIRPTNVGVPNIKAIYPKNIDNNPKLSFKNIGYETKEYAKFGTAKAIYITYIDPKKGTITATFNSDVTPGPLKQGEAMPHNVPINSINSTPDNVINPSKPGQQDKTFLYILSNYKIKNISFQIRDDVDWSTNMGVDTGHKVLAKDYWYGLQVSHLENPGYRFASGHSGGNESWDSRMNQELGGQLNPKGSMSDNWADTFSPYDIDTSKFMEGHESEFEKDNRVNISFSTDKYETNDAMNAYNALFINQSYFHACPSYKIDNLHNSSFYTDSLCGHYGFYTYAFSGFDSLSNVLFATPFACEALLSSITVFHRTMGYATDPKDPIYKTIHSPTTVKNVVWNFTKQIQTFASTQYQKYIQGSSINMNSYAKLSDHTKNVINNNLSSIGIHYNKNIFSNLSPSDTTWGALIPNGKTKVTGHPYYNNGYTEAMFGKSLKQTINPSSSPKPYFDWYYTYGAALRDSFESAINWYTSILDIYQGASSNWGSFFAPDMPIFAKDNTKAKPNFPSDNYSNQWKPNSSKKQSIMSSTYSFGYDGTKFDGNLQLSPGQNKYQFLKNFDSQSLSFQSQKFKEIQANVKKTLDSVQSAIQKTNSGFSFTGDNKISIELPVRSYNNTPQELEGLESMRKTLNSLDPRINVVAKIGYNGNDINPKAGWKQPGGHEKYDAGYTMNWSDETLPRLLSLRSPTQAQYATHYYANDLIGLGGFIYDAFRFNQYGGLIFFSELHDSNSAVYKGLDNIGMNKSKIKLLQKYVLKNNGNSGFTYLWNKTKSEQIATMTKFKVDPTVIGAFQNVNIDNIHKIYSAKLVGPASDGQNYTPFSQTKLNTKQATEFNGTFLRFLENLTRGMITDFQTNYSSDQIKDILAGIDNMAGRSLGYLGRKIDNQDALPLLLQKTWFNEPRAANGVEFTSDESVSL